MGEGSQKGMIGEDLYMIRAEEAIKVGRRRCRCHLKCHAIETAACLCFAALRLFPSVHISDLDPVLACKIVIRRIPNHDQISVSFSVLR